MEQAVKYTDLDKMAVDQLEALRDLPMDMLANCDTKLKYLKIAEADLHYVHEEVPPESMEMGSIIGYKLFATMKDGSKVETEIDLPTDDLLTMLQTQYKLAEQLLALID